MKLRNKKTGEIVDTLCEYDCTKGLCFGVDHHDGNPTMACYNSLAELNEEWEDYEEPKRCWAIEFFGEITEVTNLSRLQIETLRRYGNLFETKEEAEKAVEKLKAWKRLKDKGIKFLGWSHNCLLADEENIDIKAILPEDFATSRDDLDLLFGGEDAD